MKKLLILTAALMVLPGCFGGFPLTRATFKANNSIEGHPYVKQLAFVGMSPLYCGAAAFDVVIANPIGFWTDDDDNVVEDSEVE